MSGGNYTFTMDPDQFAGAFRNVNPFSESFASAIPGLTNFMSQQLGTPYNPQAFMNQFLGAVPAFQGITTEATSDIAQQQMNTLGALTGRVTSGIGQQLSQLGGVHTSAFPRLVAEAMAPEVAQAATQLSAQRTGLFGGLAQTAMPLFAQQQQMPYQYGLQAAGLLGGLAAPDMVAPEMQYNPSFWEQYAMPMLQLGGQIGSAFLMGG